MQQDQDIKPSLEIKTILECNDKLVTAFSSEVIRLSGALLAKGLITPELHEQMLVHCDMNTSKANKLVEGVRKSIEIAPDKFKVFLEILQEMGQTIHDAADILSSKYIELTVSMQLSLKLQLRIMIGDNM